MANDLKLQEGHPVDENLRPIKVGGEATAIETAKHGNGARVTGDFEVTGNIKSNTFNLLRTNRIESESLVIDDYKDITLDAEGGEVYIKDDGNTVIEFTDAGGRPSIKLYEDASGGTDYVMIQARENGEAIIITTDGAGANAHLTFSIDGQVQFNGCPAGFAKQDTDFAVAAVTSEGDDSTDIDFREGNKHELILTDNIAGSGENINMIFPLVSGNFILTICQDAGGGNTVAADGWKAYASDASLADNTLASDGTDGDVRWAGGSAPTLSTGGRAVDLIAIYWDAGNQTALAVASLGFATP